jgi:hypothetical protein
MPVVFLGLLNILVFLIPAESGERISYSVTVMLAITVFLSSVADSLPKTSSPISLLSYYLLANSGLSVFICLCSILIVRTCHNTDSHASGMAAIARMICKRQNKLIVPANPNTDNDINTSKTQIMSARDNFDIAETINTEKDSHFQETITDLSPSWLDVGKRLNMVMGTFSVIFWLLATVVFLVSVTTSRQ